MGVWEVAEAAGDVDGIGLGLGLSWNVASCEGSHDEGTVSLRQRYGSWRCTIKTVPPVQEIFGVVVCVWHVLWFTRAML